MDTARIEQLLSDLQFDINTRFDVLNARVIELHGQAVASALAYTDESMKKGREAIRQEISTSHASATAQGEHDARAALAEFKEELQAAENRLTKQINVLRGL